ncbi:MAG: sulfotransferase family protein [Acidimicrobiales bacterium]
MSSRFVFVGGLHRSGTSLTADLLAASAGASGLVDTGHMEDEGHYLHDVVPSAFTYGGPGKFAFDDRCQLGPSSSPEEDRRRLLAAWAHYWADGDATVKVEKSPQNLVQARWLQSVFPDARFVMVTRHPAVVALATMKWTRPGPAKLRRLLPTASMESLLRHWVVAHERFAADRPHLDHETVVRFQDVLDGVALGELGDWLDLELPPSPGRRSAGHYQRQWETWRGSRDGQKAARSWLPEVAEAIAPWGYGLDDELV